MDLVDKIQNTDSQAGYMDNLSGTQNEEVTALCTFECSLDTFSSVARMITNETPLKKGHIPGRSAKMCMNLLLDIK